MDLSSPAGLSEIIQAGRKIISAHPSWPTIDGKLLDRNKYLTASEAGNCPRQVWFTKNGQKFDAGYVENRGYFERGHDVEGWVTENLAAGLSDFGAKLHLTGSDQRSFYDDAYRLSATPDGLIDWNPSEAFQYIEIKSVDPRTNLEGMDDAKAKHKTQMRIGAWLVNTYRDEQYPLRDTGLIIYQDSSNYDRLRIFEVDLELDHSGRPGPTVLEAQKRATEILYATSAKPVPPLGLTTGDCSLCPFKDACTEAGTGLPGKRTNKGLPKFAPRGASGLLRRTYEAHFEAQRSKERFEALKATVEQAMLTNGETTMAGGPFVAEVTEVAGRKTFNKDKFEEMFKVSPDLVLKQGAPYLKFSITKTDTETEESDN